MADKSDVALMSHLMRRAGFGTTRDEIEALVDQGYEATVDQLLDPDSQPDIDEALLFRYHPMAELIYTLPHAQMNWLYRMVNTGRPLREKMALFWHHVFATGYDKVTDAVAMHSQIEMFREHGTGNYRDLLVRLAQNPAMIYWLDNQDNHKRAPNENWGRELLLWGPHLWEFEYKPEDHDNGEKTFLGHTGNFNGEDIVDIVVRQPACPQFISRHLYNFFVADEPEVPKWPNDPPLDPDAIAQLSEVFVESNYEITPVLNTLFNSDFFKESAYRKVRSPAETVVGTLKVTGDLSDPDPRWGDMAEKPASMGQDLMNPPSVEGWHTGREWINSGALINRVNFAADRLGNPDLPGVVAITRRVGSNGPTMSAEELVDRCLDEMGPLTVDAETHGELVERVSAGGAITLKPGDEDRQFSQRVSDLLAMIAGTKEFLFT